jgi:hypothetical protein
MYSIDGLAKLPGLATGRPPQLRQIGIHVNGGLFGQATIRMGGDVVLGAPHRPSVEGRLDA